MFDALVWTVMVYGWKYRVEKKTAIIKSAKKVCEVGID